jgi:hypothetical protein
VEAVNGISGLPESSGGAHSATTSNRLTPAQTEVQATQRA